jgi:hypothetical protein
MARKLLIAFSLLLIIPVVIAQGAEERECCPSRAGRDRDWSEVNLCL